MNRTHVGREAFKYLMMITVLLTGTFGALVFGERPTIDKPKVIKRHLARADVNLKPTVMPIECWDNLTNLKLPPPTKWVRITGRVCEGEIGLDQVRITNDTNHVVTTILPLGDGLTTDLIPLVEGANDLTFTIARPEGPVVTHLTLTR